MWHVYEIVGDKAGCVREDQLERRRKDQREKGEMVIRSTHSCIYEASDAEIALQKQKGYKVDRIPYWKLDNLRQRPKTIDRQKQRESGKKGGLNGGRKGGLKTATIRKTCPNCGYESTPGGLGNHMRKCT